MNLNTSMRHNKRKFRSGKLRLIYEKKKGPSQDSNYLISKRVKGSCLHLTMEIEVRQKLKE